MGHPASGPIMTRVLSSQADAFTSLAPQGMQDLARTPPAGVVADGPEDKALGLNGGCVARRITPGEWSMDDDCLRQ
jgi:hypothetical protein